MHGASFFPARLTACVLAGLLALGAPVAAQSFDEIPDSLRRNVTDSMFNPARRSAAYLRMVDRADMRARRILARIECAMAAGRLRAAGRFGPPATAGRQFSCLVVDGVLAGAYYDVDAAARRVTALRVVKLYASQAAYTGAIDTTRLLAHARASRVLQARFDTAYRAAARPFGVVVFDGDADTVEAWMVPPAVLGVGVQAPDVGGVSGMLFDATGQQVRRVVDDVRGRRLAAAAADGSLRISARTDSVPPLGAMVLARALAPSGRPLTIGLSTHQAIFVRASPQTGPMWIHRPW